MGVYFTATATIYSMSLNDNKVIPYCEAPFDGRPLGFRKWSVTADSLTNKFVRTNNSSKCLLSFLRISNILIVRLLL